MATISEALATAVQHHQAGRLDVAEQIYRQIIAIEPNQADAIHLLGVIARQVGKPEAAVEYIERAIGLNGTEGVFHGSLGNALKDQGKLDEAIACYRRALKLKPDHVDALYNLGIALNDQGNRIEAVACYQRAVELKPDHAEAHTNLGTAFYHLGRLDEAVASYRRALELQPGFAAAHNNLGNTLKDQGKLDEAVVCYQRALALKPTYAEAHNNLGNAFKDQGKLDQALACYRRALELKPDFAAAHFNLGDALKDQGKLDQAVACFRRVLEIKPDFAEAHINLGNAFKDQGKLDEAVACYRRAVELQPTCVEAHSNLVFALNFCPGYDAKTIYEEHRRWNEQFAEPLARFIQPHSNERSADRRLRIGYVSPDFRENVVGLFLLPLLEAHDHERFEIFCYASVCAPDAMTDRCRAHADVWRNVFGTSDEQLTDIIRQDGIDVLVDLTMHTANNRLLVFARKPAPVQVTYLAYAGTTGLSSMDYRLTDPYLDPPAQDDPLYSEESIRLPETYWCYRPLIQTPAVNALPALQTGHITFGCLNNFSKVSTPTLAAWVGLLQAMPDSRLILHAHSGDHRDRVRQLFARQGVLPERLTYADKVPMPEYFQLYHGIDVALDPFPYGGGTTTCDALWMGVPVVTLAGQTAVGRGGLSILSNVGLADLVAYDSAQYVRIARELAGDLARLCELRATLRERLRGSPLMDAPRFARNVEAAYRTMWQRWCDR